MNVDLLRHQQRWKDGLQDLRTGFATLEAQVALLNECLCVFIAISTCRSSSGSSVLPVIVRVNRQGSYRHGKPGKVLELNSNPQSFGKVMEMCYIHMFIYAEF